MFLKKIMTTAVVVLALGMAIITGGSLVVGQAEQPDKAKVGPDVKFTVEKPMEPAAKQEKEAFTAWGKEVDGIQAGLGFRNGEKRAYHHGETVTLVFRLRNVGKADVKLQCYVPYPTEIQPTVLDGEGKPFVIQNEPDHRTSRYGADTLELAAGKEINSSS